MGRRLRYSNPNSRIFLSFLVLAWSLSTNQYVNSHFFLYKFSYGHTIFFYGSHSLTKSSFEYGFLVYASGG